MNWIAVQTEHDLLTDDALRDMLAETKTIAIYGWSDKEDRPSHEVGNYLRKQGYHVIPVNPRLAGRTWDGQPIYAKLQDVPESIDLVDVFRRPEFTPEAVKDAVAVGAKAIWLQLGIVNDDAAEIARQAGVPFVQDRCTQIEHLRLIRGLALPGM